MYFSYGCFSFWIMFRISRVSPSDIIRLSMCSCCPDVCYTMALYDVTLFRWRQPVMHKAGQEIRLTCDSKRGATCIKCMLHTSRASILIHVWYVLRLKPRHGFPRLLWHSWISRVNCVSISVKTSLWQDILEFFYQKISSFYLERIIR